MRYYFSLLVVFAVGALVLAAPPDHKPTTRPSVNKEDVKPGQIYWPRLRYVEPKDRGVQKKYANGNHPVVVVSHVDAHDKVKVAPISRHPNTHWRSTEPASNYADLGGSINLGQPKTVHVAHLEPPTNGVVAVRPGRLKPLIDRINANCPPDKKLAGCEPSGSAQGNTVHGRPEHDHSKQSSQQSSSNKSSSSQGSRPGTSKQSSQESSSSQGRSQLGGSKQDSPPGSSDHGWQVVTGRRRNKARGK